MATAFPGGLDNFPNPSPTDLVENVDPQLDHNVQHGNANDAIEALEAKVGVDGSAVTSSLDYKVTNTTWLTGSGVPSNGNGANGNFYLDTATGIVYRKAAGTWSAVYTPAAGGQPVSPAAVSGFLGWTHDNALWYDVGVPVSGTLYANRIWLQAGTVNNLYVIDGALSISSLTTCKMALYDFAGTTLLSSTPDLLSGWASGTMRTFTLNTPQVVTAGLYTIAFWAVATTPPNLLRASTNGVTPGAIVASNTSIPRYATANTGLTTTAPATVTARTTAPTRAYWMAAG